MNKILVVAVFAGLAAVALAQSNDSKQKPSSDSREVTSPRDAASGQASGKRTHNPPVFRKEISARDAATGQASGVVAPRDSSTGMPTGKTSATDDWQAPATKTGVKPVADVDQDGAADRNAGGSNLNSQKRVATGDVNGDGAASANHEVKSPRDLATGQASGKRQHAPVPNPKNSDTAPAAQK